MRTSYVSNSSKIHVKNICLAIKKIQTETLYTRSAHKLMQYTLKNDEITFTEFDVIKKLKNRILNNVDKSRYLSNLICLITKVPEYSEVVLNNLLEELTESFSQIDGDWNKVDVGFKISASVSKYHSEVALKIREEVVELRDKSEINAVDVKDSYCRCLDLIIRVNSTMLKVNHYDEENVSTIISRINLLSGNIEKSKYFAKLISSLQINDFETHAKIIIQNNIIPVLESYENTYSKEFGLVFYFLSPVIFNFDKDTFNQYFDQVTDKKVANNLLSFTISHIFEKVMLLEPFYHNDKHKYQLSYVDSKHIFSLIKKLQQDWMIFSNLKRLTPSLINIKKSDGISEAQKADIIYSYQCVIDMFPIADCIQHSGFKICCEALRLYFENVRKPSVWLDLIKQAKDISNQSDYIYTTTCVLEYSSPLSLTERKKILENTISDVSLVNISIERIDLIENIFSSCKGICRATVKKALNEALLLTTEEDTPEYRKKRMALIDASFELDSKLPSSISALVDNDPFRKKLIEENIKTKEDTDKLEEEFKSVGASKLNVKTQNEFAKYCHDQLAKLNSKVSIKRKRKEILTFIQNLDSLNSSNLHIVLSYFLQAFGEVDKSKLSVIENMQPIFDNLLLNSSVFSKIYKISGVTTPTNIRDEESIVLGTEKEEVGRALRFIKNWTSSKKIKSLIISEPYFGLDNLEFLADSIDRDFSINVTLISSIESYSQILSDMSDNGGFEDIDEYIEQYWKTNICPDHYPNIKFIFAGKKGDKEPVIHDRWWINSEGTNGIKLGTSINGIGNKFSGINVMSGIDSSNVYSILSGFISTDCKELKGEKIRYKYASLY